MNETFNPELSACPDSADSISLNLHHPSFSFTYHRDLVLKNASYLLNCSLLSSETGLVTGEVDETELKLDRLFDSLSNMLKSSVNSDVVYWLLLFRC